MHAPGAAEPAESASAPAAPAVSKGAIARDAALVALAKVAAVVAVLASGFVAVSDDDFSRVVIAEEWARAPRLDASGTSWLPLPFWVTGAAMRAFGRELAVAWWTAAVLGVASALLVLAAARRVLASAGPLAEHAPLAGACVAAVFPWSARLAHAPVPELPTAALGLYAVSTAAPGSTPRARLAGAVAAAAACLCRYDAWPLAAAFALVALVDAARAKASRGVLGAAAPVALASPLAWLAWNRHAHGDALHFLARVSAYSRAVGGAGEARPLERLVAYPIAMVRAEPELFALCAIGLVALALVDRAGLRRLFGALARPAALLGAQLAALAAAMVKDGAPTHHPERATMSALLLVAIVAGASLATALARLAARRPALAIPIALAPALALALAVVLVRPPERASYAQRGDEVGIGIALGRQLHGGRRALLEVADYGYFAVLAASGRPEQVVLDRSIDPRRPAEPSSFAAPDALARRLADLRPDLVVARAPAPDAPPIPGLAVAFRAGAWALWRLEPPASP
jgi:hypothetical protein